MRLKFKKNDSESSHKCQTTVFLNGGLGNQLFQLAYGIEISRIRNSTLYLETILLDQDRKRNYALDIFGVPQNKSFELSGSNIVLTGQSNICDCEQLEIRESHFFYTDKSSQIFKVGRLSIHGYWQSQLYFEKSSELIRSLIAVSLKSNVKEKYGVMHIRRGDFLHDPRTRDFHGLLGHTYYLKACKLMPKDVKTIYLISDDLLQANQILQEVSRVFPQARFLIFQEASSEKDCLSLMANSDFVVTANSSFSWWGAWLSNAQTVVAPRNYFARETARVNNLVDLYPEDWHLA